MHRHKKTTDYGMEGGGIFAWIAAILTLAVILGELT